jgi:hypothetical protein
MVYYHEGWTSHKGKETLYRDWEIIAGEYSTHLRYDWSEKIFTYWPAVKNKPFASIANRQLFEKATPEQIYSSIRYLFASKNLVHE